MNNSSRSYPPGLAATTDVSELRNAALTQYDANSQLRKALVEAQNQLKQTNLKVIKAGITPNDVHSTPFAPAADQRQVNELLFSQRERLEQKERELRALRNKFHEKNVGPMPYKGRPGDRTIKRTPSTKRKPKQSNNQPNDQPDDIWMGASTVNTARDTQHNDEQLDDNDDDLHDQSNEHQSLNQSMEEHHDPDDDRNHLDELSSTLAQRLSNTRFNNDQSIHQSVDQSPHESPRYQEQPYTSHSNLDQFIHMRPTHQKQQIHEQSYYQSNNQHHVHPPPPPDHDLSTLQNQLQTTQSRLATLAGHFESLQSSFSAKVDLLATTMNELNDSRAENERLNQLVRKLESDRSVNQSHRHTADVLRLEIDSLTGENAALTERIQSLTRSLYEADSLEHQRQALLIHSHLNQSQAFDSKLQQLNGSVKSLEIERDALTKRLDAKRSELDRQSAQLGLVTAEHSTLSQAHLALSQEHQALHNETRQWRDKALYEQKTASELRCQVDEMQLRLKREEARSTQLRHELQTQLSKPQPFNLPQYPEPVVQSAPTSVTRKLDPFDVDRAFTDSSQTAISIQIHSAALTPARFDNNSLTLISAEWPGLSQQVCYSDVQQGVSPVYNLPIDFVVPVSDQMLTLLRSQPLIVRLYDANVVPHVSVGEVHLSVSRLFDGQGATEYSDELSVKSRAGQLLANVAFTVRTLRPIFQLPAAVISNGASARAPEPTATQSNPGGQYSNIVASQKRSSAAPRRVVAHPVSSPSTIEATPQRSPTGPSRGHSRKQSEILNMGADTPQETPRKVLSSRSSPRPDNVAMRGRLEPVKQNPFSPRQNVNEDDTQSINHQTKQSVTVEDEPLSHRSGYGSSRDDELFAESEAAMPQQSAPRQHNPKSQSMTSARSEQSEQSPQMQLRVTVHACSILPTNKVRLGVLSVSYGLNCQLETDPNRLHTFVTTFPVSSDVLQSRPAMELQVFNAEHSITPMADLSIDCLEESQSSAPRWFALTHGPTQSAIGSIQLSYSCEMIADEI